MTDSTDFFGFRVARTIAVAPSPAEQIPKTR